VTMLCSMYDYYARLGSLTVTETANAFADMRPLMAEPGKLNHAGHVARGATSRLLGRRMVRSDAPGDPGTMFVDRPNFGLSLGQFRQLCLDCDIIGEGCRMSDVGRLFALSSRTMVIPPAPSADSGPASGRSEEGSGSSSSEEDEMLGAPLPEIKQLPAEGIHNIMHCMGISG
jgi:hypothetical protein